eukprot:2527306-Prorocentrum_lima.AAC.1
MGRPGIKIAKHGLEPVLLGQQGCTPSCLFKEPEEMEPTIQQWMFMRDCLLYTSPSPRDSTSS